MPWAWNDPIPDDFDWSQKDFFEIFRKASYERHIAFNRGNPTSPPSWMLSPITAGFDVQQTAVYRDLQLIGSLFYSTLPEDRRNEAGQVTSIDNPGVPLPNQIFPLTVHQYLIKNGLRGTYNTEANPGSPGYWHTTGYARKKPREIQPDGTFNTTDRDGNTLANGMIAYSWFNATLGGITFAPGQRWKRSLGVWVPADPNDMPDVLDSAADRPNACQGTQIQPGDYIGPWLFRDIMQLYNACIYTREGSLRGRSYDPNAGDWGPDGPYSGGYYGGAPWGWDYTGADMEMYGRWTYFFPHTIARAYTFFTIVNSTGSDAGPFDSYVLHHQSTPKTTDYDSPTYTASAAIPKVTPTGPYGDLGVGSGWAMAKWDVAGGFQYHA